MATTIDAAEQSRRDWLAGILDAEPDDGAFSMPAGKAHGAGMNARERWAAVREGGPGSGNWGHAGVKGSRGGSMPSRSGGAVMSFGDTAKTARDRWEAARGKPADSLAQGPQVFHDQPVPPPPPLTPDEQHIKDLASAWDAMSDNQRAAAQATGLVPMDAESRAYLETAVESMPNAFANISVGEAKELMAGMDMMTSPAYTAAVKAAGKEISDEFSKAYPELTMPISDVGDTPGRMPAAILTGLITKSKSVDTAASAFRGDAVLMRSASAAEKALLAKKAETIGDLFAMTDAMRTIVGRAGFRATDASASGKLAAKHMMALSSMPLSTDVGGPMRMFKDPGKLSIKRADELAVKMLTDASSFDPMTRAMSSSSPGELNRLLMGKIMADKSIRDGAEAVLRHYGRSPDTIVKIKLEEAIPRQLNNIAADIAGQSDGNAAAWKTSDARTGLERRIAGAGAAGKPDATWLANANGLRKADAKASEAVTKDVIATHDTVEHGSFKPVVHGVYEVVQSPAKARAYDEVFQSTGNVQDRTFYHGTTHGVGALIAGGGFKVPKAVKTGRMLGDGVYLAGNSSKSGQYVGEGFTRHKGARGALLVNKAAFDTVAKDNPKAAKSNKTVWGQKGGRLNLLNDEWCVRNPMQARPAFIVDYEIG